MPWTAAAIAGSAILGAGTSIMGSNKAASSADKAAQTQLDMFNQTRQTLAPYTTTGYNALTDAYSLARTGPTGGGPDYVSMAAANLPGNLTQAQLEATPGYQFTRDQGLKSVQSAAAARGLGVSGAALKGAATYATGLADSTYTNRFNESQQRFNDYINLNTGQQGNLQNQFSRLSGIATLGENAGAGTGTAGTAAANAAGNYINQGGLASAAGYTGAANALTGGVNSYLGYSALKDYLAKPGLGGYDATKYNGPVNSTQA